MKTPRIEFVQFYQTGSKMNSLEKILEAAGRLRDFRVLNPTLCPACHDGCIEFRDTLSVAENKISGLCQKCQDEVFSEEQDEKEM
jgi:hypothetical protein